MNKPTDGEVVEFIMESNAIEEIHIPVDGYLKGWKNKRHDNPEIDGHVKAFDEMLNWMFSDNFTKITPEHITKLHTTLMQELLPASWYGFRTQGVQVCGRLCPPALVVKDLIQKWCDKVNALEYPTENDILQVHLAYEDIHPFMDGNGRSGRLLWIWLRYKYNFGYKCFKNKTKNKEYYPLFDQFLWADWLDQK